MHTDLMLVVGFKGLNIQLSTVVELPKACVCGRSLAGIAGSNPTVGICLL
jgi:hypothetical protein